MTSQAFFTTATPRLRHSHSPASVEREEKRTVVDPQNYRGIASLPAKVPDSVMPGSSPSACPREALTSPDIKIDMSRLEDIYPDPKPRKKEPLVDCFGGCTNPRVVARLDAQFLEEVFIQLM